MVGWHHQLNEHELEQTLKDDEGQGDMTCFSPWGHKELDTTWQLSKNHNNTNTYLLERFRDSFLHIFATFLLLRFINCINILFNPVYHYIENIVLGIFA